MPLTGRCPNRADCLLSFRNELITVPDGAPVICPECKTPLIPAISTENRAARWVIPLFILGGISGLIITGSAAVYIQVQKLKHGAPAGQIGTSFEQAQIAAEHGEFLPSRHMPSVAASATPDTSGTMDAGAQYEEPSPTPDPGH